MDGKTTCGNWDQVLHSFKWKACKERNMREGSKLCGTIFSLGLLYWLVFPGDSDTPPLTQYQDTFSSTAGGTDFTSLHSSGSLFMCCSRQTFRTQKCSLIKSGLQHRRERIRKSFKSHVGLMLKHMFKQIKQM